MESDIALSSAAQASESTAPQPRPCRVRPSAWMFLAALFAAPLALSCRPYPLVMGLGIYLLVMTGVWAVECVVGRRKPCVSRALLVVVTLLALLTILPLFNATAVFDGLTHSFLHTKGGIPWLPMTVDRWNSVITIIQTLGALGALLVAVNLGGIEAWRRRICVTAAAAGGVVVIIGLLQKMGPLAGFTLWLRDHRWAQGDPFGTFDYHGNAGSFLNLVIPAIAGMAMLTKNRWGRWAWVVLLAACYVGVVLNVTRAGLLISAVLAPVVLGTVYWGVLRHHLWSAIGLSAAALVLIGVLVWTGRSPAVKRLGDRSRTLWTPYYDRTLTYKTAWNLGKERPVFGWGPGSYRLLVQTSAIRGNYFAPAYVPGNSFSVLSHVEEDYLQTLVEWGWVGLGVWGLVPLGGMASLVIGWWRRGARPAWPYVLIGAGIVSVYVHALIDCPLQNSAIQVYVCAYLGLAWSCLRWDREAGMDQGDLREPMKPSEVHQMLNDKEVVNES